MLVLSNSNIIRRLNVLILYLPGVFSLNKEDDVLHNKLWVPNCPEWIRVHSNAKKTNQILISKNIKMMTKKENPNGKIRGQCDG